MMNDDDDVNLVESFGQCGSGKKKVSPWNRMIGHSNGLAPRASFDSKLSDQRHITPPGLILESVVQRMPHKSSNAFTFMPDVPRQIH